MDIEPIPIKEFREINFGIWEGLSNDNMKAKYRDEIYLWRKEPENLRIQGQKLYMRFRKEQLIP